MSADAQDSRPVRRGRGRPRGQDSAVVREGALRAAIELIARQGFAATSMAQVATAAGISPSGLAHHFPSRRALLGAVLDHRDAMDEVTINPTATATATSPWAVFESLAGLARVNMERRQLVLLYTAMIGEAATAEHPAHEWMLRHYRAVVGMLAEGVRAGQESGDVRAEAPAERIARATIALMDGLQVQWLLDPSIDMGRVMDDHVAELKEKWGVDPA